MAKTITDLEVEFAGIKFRNPIIAASGLPSATLAGELLRRVGVAGAGGVCTRTLSWSACAMAKEFKRVRPRFVFIDDIGMVHWDIVFISPERWVEKEIKIAKKGGVPVIASILGGTEEEWVKLAKMAEKANADMLEVNLSSPSYIMWKGERIPSENPLAVKEVTKVVKEIVSIPVMVKLTAKADDIGLIAKAAEEGGADAVASMNTYPNVIGIDSETEKPLMPVLGVYSGPGIKPIAIGCVVKMATSANIPVCGIGGISNSRDAIEMIMAGASVVQICTAILRRGLRVFNEINDGMVQFMRRKGYKSPNELVGLALKHMQDPRKVKEEKKVAYISPELCTLCLECINLCPFDAVCVDRTVSNSTAKVDVNKCDGCGICVLVCPVKAANIE